MPKLNRSFVGLFQKRVFLILLAVVGCLLLSGCEMGIDKGGADAYDERNASCWTCQFFGYVYRTLGVISQNTAPTLCSASVTLMVAFLALWLAFYMGQNLIWGVEEPDYRTIWGTVIKTIAKACLIGIVLSSADMFFSVVRMIYLPIVELWMFFAMEILKDLGGDSLMGTLKNVKIATDYKTTEGVFPEALAQQIETIIYKIQVAFDMGISIGTSLLTLGDFVAFLLAAFVMWTFFYMSITFPLYFIDAVVRFGLAMIVMPLVFVAWVLPIPGAGQIVSTFFKYIMSAGAQFMTAAMFTAFAVSMAQTFLEQRMGISGTAAGQSIGEEMKIEMTMLKAPALLLFTMCFYLSKLAERAPTIGAKITATEAGENMMGSTIAALKKAAKDVAVMIVGLFSGGAAVAISMADEAAKQAGDVASGGAAEKDGGG